MIQLVSQLLDGLIQQAQIDNHAGFWIGIAAYEDVSMICVAVYAATSFLIDLTMQGMSGIKEESLA
ncbi:hypothetical protein SAMN05192539_1002149 [Paraburkholderia diazotrophica]|uniref:Uncharacterized protein n=1 Tax=Paraburkholderia diazotrophica TaxID=667676 RepID=A0A1H6RFP3_9BURK|nr:hypothetical protein SAMN05192539_1002149 [Paraburkholderia diazotrophica]